MQKIQMNRKDTENMTLEDAFNDFIKKCKVRNLSDNTIIYYNDCFKIFTKHVSKDNYIKDIDIDVIDDYTLELAKTIKTTSVNSQLRGMRAFLYHCMQRDYLPTFKIKMQIEDKEIKETYTNAELKLLLKKPDLKKCSFVQYRQWVTTAYLLGTGNRVSTVVNIKIKDLDLENGLITLTKQKNRKQQIIPLSTTLVSVLQEYLGYRNGNSEDYLFCTETGTFLHPSSLTSAVALYNNSRGVLKTSAHLFRHTWAKLSILAGMDIFRLQKLGNWKDLDMVRNYVNMYDADITKDHDRFNPLEQQVSRNFIKMDK